MSKLFEAWYRILEKIGLIKRRSNPKCDVTPALPTFRYYFEQLTDQKLYLTDYVQTQAFKGSSKVRYIFVTNQLLYDVFYEQEKKKITDLSWTSLESLKVMLPRVFSIDRMPSVLRAFSEIPADVLTRVPQISQKVDGIIKALENPSQWIELKYDHDHWGQTKVYIHNNEDRGYCRILVNELAVSGIELWSPEKMKDRLTESVAARPEIEDASADMGLIQECERIWQLANDTVGRIESGEVLEIDSSYFYLCHEDKFFSAYAYLGKAERAVEYSKSRVLEDVIDFIARLKKTPKFITLSEDIKGGIANILDKKNYFNLIREGKIRIGGGATSDMQWSIQFKDGVFVRTGDDGDGNTYRNFLDEETVKDIIEKKRFGWVKNN